VRNLGGDAPIKGDGNSDLPPRLGRWWWKWWNFSGVKNGMTKYLPSYIGIIKDTY